MDTLCMTELWLTILIRVLANPCFHCKFIWKSSKNCSTKYPSRHRSYMELARPKESRSGLCICPSSFESDTKFASQLFDSEEFKELIAAMVTEQDVLSLAQMCVFFVCHAMTIPTRLSIGLHRCRC